MTDPLLTEKAPARRSVLRSLILAPVAALATHKLILPNQPTPGNPFQANNGGLPHA